MHDAILLDQRRGGPAGRITIRLPKGHAALIDMGDAGELGLGHFQATPDDFRVENHVLHGRDDDLLIAACQCVSHRGFGHNLGPWIRQQIV